MKTVISILLLMLSFSLTAQEKLAEFTTTHAQAMGATHKIQVKFELYQDSLVMIQMEKSVLKEYGKMGMPAATSFVHPFVREEYPNVVLYKFRNETLDFIINLGSKGMKPSVIMKQKDTFSNEVTEQVFISI